MMDHDIFDSSFQLNYSEYSSVLENKAKQCHRRISKTLTYDIHNRMNKSFVEIIRDRVYAQDSPLYPQITSPGPPTTSSIKSDKNNNNKYINIKNCNNEKIKMGRIRTYIDLHDNNDDNIDNNDDDNFVNLNLNDEQLLHDVSLELKNLNMYCDYSTPSPTTFAPNRLKEKALQRGQSLAYIVKQQLYRNRSNLNNSTRFSPSHMSPKKRPSTADDTRRRYEARQRLKSKKNNQTANIKYEPFIYSFYNDLQYYDLLVSAEYCSNCNSHISLRHDSNQYELITKNCLEILLQSLAEYKLNARIGVIKVTPPVQTNIKENDTSHQKITSNLKSNTASKRPNSAPSIRSKDQSKNYDVSHNITTIDCNSNIVGSRLGALEIQIAYKDSTGKIHAKVIHSKLQSLTWPIKAKLIESFKIIIQDYKKSGIMTSYANDYVGMYDFLFIDDTDTPKKEQIHTDTPAETIKEQVQTCPMFDKCIGGCRAITSDTSDNILSNMSSALTTSNSLNWLADTSAFALAHNQDYTNGDFIAVEIRKIDKVNHDNTESNKKLNDDNSHIANTMNDNNGYYNVPNGNKIDTFTSKYKGILEIYEDKDLKKKKKQVKKTTIEDTAYKFSFI